MKNPFTKRTNKTIDILNIHDEYIYIDPPKRKEYKTMIKLLENSHEFLNNGEKELANMELNNLVKYIDIYIKGNK